MLKNKLKRITRKIKWLVSDPEGAAIEARHYGKKGANTIKNTANENPVKSGLAVSVAAAAGIFLAYKKFRKKK